MVTALPMVAASTASKHSCVAKKLLGNIGITGSAFSHGWFIQDAEKLQGKAYIFVDYDKMSSFPNTTEASIPCVNNHWIRTLWLLDSKSGVWSSSIRDCVFDTMTHESTWRDGIRHFMTTNRNACATLQNQGRDYQNIEILCWMFSDEHKPPYFRTPHCFKH